MINGSERIISETPATSFCIEDQGEKERNKKRNCWQRTRSAFYHSLENVTDCFDFWFCKNECFNFCCTCDDYDDDDENEQYGVAPALIRSERKLETSTEKGIANDAVGTENEEFSSMEINAISLECGSGDGNFEGGNNSEKHSDDHQSSGVQNDDHGVCDTGGGADAENQSGGLKERYSGDHQPSGGQHNDHGVCFIGGGGDAVNTSGGQKGSQSGDQQFRNGSDRGNREFGGGSDSGNHSGGHHTNHGASDSGNNSGGHHASGSDHAVSNFGDGGESGGGGWGEGVDD